MDPHIDKWKAEIQELEAKMKEASADVRIEIQNQINDLKRKIDDSS